MDTIQATSSEETTVSMGRISGKWQFLDLDTSASNTTELDPYKFTHFLLEVVRLMDVWISNLVGEALKSSFCFLFSEAERYNSAQASTLGEKIFSLQARGSTQPMIHDGTELKKLIPAWGA